MSEVRLLLCALAGLLMVSCGGGQAPLPEAKRVSSVESASDVATPDGRPLIVAFGDSLSAGHGVEPGKSYPAFLQAALDDAGYRYRVVNAGVSGDTTGGGLSRAGAITGLKPAAVILELGGNDGLRGLPIESTSANLEQIIGILRKSGALVVLAGMTLPPNYGAGYIEQFENVYKRLAAKYRLPLIPFLLEGVAGRPGLMQEDGIHPTAEGNRVAARNVFRVIAPFLKK